MVKILRVCFRNLPVYRDRTFTVDLYTSDRVINYGVKPTGLSVG